MNNSLNYPKSPKIPIIDTVHRKELTDNFRWLEDPNSEQTKAWIEKQNNFSLDLLEQIDGQEELRSRLRFLYQYEQLTEVKERGGQIFYLKKQIDKQQPILYKLSKDNKETVLVDVNSADSSGLSSLDYYFPSIDGSLLAYGISQGGSEWSEISILNLTTGEHFSETIPRARWSTIIWKKDNSGFYYTRFPKAGEVADGQEVFNSHVRFHTLGTDPNIDPIIFAYPEKPQEYPLPIVSPDEKFMLVIIHRFISNDLFLVDLEDSERTTIAVIKGSKHFYLPKIHNRHIYILSDFEHSNYAIYKTTRASLHQNKWEKITSPKEDVIQEIHLTRENFVLLWLSNVSNKITIHELDGKFVSNVPITDRGSIGNGNEFSISSKVTSNLIYFNFETFIHPARTYEYNIARKTLSIIHNPTLNINSKQIEVKDTCYKSKDGTRVHMFIIHSQATKLNAANPTILYGYGGFDISMTPSYGPHIITWVENGGVYAIANIRGGGEHGEAWHKAGQLKNKQNVFDDFIYAAKYLIEAKYCSSQTLGIWGGSNGGLLVGAVAVQEPTLFAAVYCSVPLLDMLRYHLFSIGKTWTPEYGSPDAEEDFQWLYAYSPYHNVSLELDSPAMLFKTALNDSRVEPCHALKMAALMQNLPNITKPILLLVDAGAGHGAGKPLDKLITDSTRFLSFFHWKLSMN